MSLHKLGPHNQGVTDAGLAWSRKAPIVKAIDDPRPLREAPAGSIRIFRRYFPNQDVSRNGADVVRDVLAALGDAPATHIELLNEVAQRLGQGLERHVEMTREAVAYLRGRRPDLKIVGYCFSTGSPEIEDWAYLRAHGFGGAHVVGWHAYWGLPPNPSSPGSVLTPYNALRYRTFWRAGDPPIALTEVGRDKVRDGSGGVYVGQGGWLADGVSADQFVAELAAFDAEISKDAYVLGATPFTSGPSTQWQKYSMDSLAPRLAAMNAPPAPAPVPVPPPGGNVTFIDQADLDFMHKWQNERNANNQDPSSLNAYQAFLTAVGKDPSNPRHYGAMVADAPAPAPVYSPTVTPMRAPAVSIQGTFAAPPKGVILHSSRSGQPLTEAQEALATARYCQSGTGGNDLAWTATIGPDIVYPHTEPAEWGWNAGASSKEYLAVEFAQAHLGDAISDKQVNAFAFWFATIARKRWPALPLAFLMHGDTPQGQQAGKTDAYPAGSTEAEAFRTRIRKRLKDVYGIA